MLKKWLPLLMGIALAAAGITAAQAGIVTTVEVHQAGITQFQAMPEKRDWLQQQLIEGGVEHSLAIERVAALTDDQVNQVFQRIDEHPAGGNVLLALLVIVLITDIIGVTDIFPFIRPIDR